MSRTLDSIIMSIKSLTQVEASKRAEIISAEGINYNISFFIKEERYSGFLKLDFQTKKVKNF